MSESLDVEKFVEEWQGQGGLPTLFTRTADGAVNVWMCWVMGDAVFVRWGQENGAMQDASFQCEAKNVGRANATNAHQQALKEAVAKWKKQVKKKYHWDRDRAAGEQRLKPMLAKSWKDHGHNAKYPVVVQPKYDGLRCFAYRKDGAPFLQSRGGDPYVVHHILEELRPFFARDFPVPPVLDGELYAHGVNLQTLNSYVRRPQEDSGLLSYMVYDVVLPNAPEMDYAERRALLEYYFQTKLQGVMVKLVPDRRAHQPSEVMSLHDDCVERGFEGAIVRLYEYPYRFGYRSEGLLKVKAWQDAEFPIVGHRTGRGKFAEFPIFMCEAPNGSTFEVSPKGTDAERAELLRRAPKLKGQLMKVQFFDWTAAGIPHYPVGLGVRSRSDLS